jgi:hypothetical protein
MYIEMSALRQTVSADHFPFLAEGRMAKTLFSSPERITMSWYTSGLGMF